MKQVIFVVEGLFEKSDSIGFDCVYQYRLLKAALPANIDITVYASNFDVELYPNVKIRKIDELYEQKFDKNTCLIYHFCDGWEAFEKWLPSFAGVLITRWHNNTPPWFFAKYSRRSVERTIRGFRSILNLLKIPGNSIACNSDFSIRQLEVLGGRRDDCCVVYPASRFLDSRSDGAVVPSAVNANRVDLLFVGRLVPHKGHRHIILSAAALKQKVKADIHVHLPGRPDRSAINYSKELNELAARHAINLHVGGEISQADLENLYRTATAFVCMSEHEGFGLPVFEAMQSGLPVIAWAGTALEEMIGDHPLAVDVIDYDVIANNIVKILNPAGRSEIVNWQNENVLDYYDKDIVEKQLLSSIADFLSGTDSRPKSNRINLNLDVPREVVGNYLTLHDLVTYETLLEDGLANLSVPSTPVQSNGDGDRTAKLLLAPSRFIIPDSAKLDEQSKSANFQLKGNNPDSREEYFIFGPYIRLPVGFYTAEFLVKIPFPRYVGKKITCDAASNGTKVASIDVPVKNLTESGVVALDFYVADSTELVELRVRCAVDASATLAFSGVELSRVEKVNLFGANGQAATRTNAWNGSTIGLGERATLFAKKAAFAVAAAITRNKKINPMWHFVRGDRARDQRNWSECVEAYRTGLGIDASRADIWVQLGHAYKELGKYDESQRAYAVALQFKHNDADIHLNVGHLMKLQQDKASAAIHYMSAVQKDTTSLDAVRELMDLGFSLDEIAQKIRTS